MNPAPFSLLFGCWEGTG